MMVEHVNNKFEQIMAAGNVETTLKLWQVTRGIYKILTNIRFLVTFTFHEEMRELEMMERNGYYGL